jgi:hypothetical protein
MVHHLWQVTKSEQKGKNHFLEEACLMLRQSSGVLDLSTDFTPAASLGW